MTLGTSPAGEVDTYAEYEEGISCVGCRNGIEVPLVASGWINCGWSAIRKLFRFDFTFRNRGRERELSREAYCGSIG